MLEDHVFLGPIIESSANITVLQVPGKRHKSDAGSAQHMLHC